MTKASSNPFPSILVAEQGSAPATPSTGYGRIYCKSDGLYFIGDDGVEIGPLAAASAPGGTAYYPTRTYRMLHGDSLVTVGNALTTGSVTGFWGRIWYQNTPANGDTFTHSFMLKAGTYTLYVQGKTATNCGLIDWYIDDTKVVSLQDWYGSSTDEVVKTAASLTVTGDGRHVLKGVINGKNASASDYYMQLQSYWFVPASDAAEV
jgi:hypothetical protein